MNRAEFGLFGAGFTDDEFGQALAGYAARNYRVLLSGSSEYELRWNTHPRDLVTTKANEFRDVWRNFRGIAKPPLRIEWRAELAPDLVFFNEMLNRPAVADSVYFLANEPDVPVAWQWPLRIGIFADDRASDLRDALLTNHPHLGKLVHFVEIGPGAAECDLLLLLCNLRASLQRVLTSPVRISADCVLVLGGAKVDADRVPSLMQAIRTEVVTAGVALTPVAKKKRDDWFAFLIEHLSHNENIDLALANAARGVNAPAPLVRCSRRLAEFARLSNFAERLGTTMKKMSPAVPEMPAPDEARWRFGGGTVWATQDIGDRLIREAHSFEYQSETGDATAVVATRNSFEEAHAQPVLIPKAMAAPAPRAAAAAPLGEVPRMQERLDRFVHAELMLDRKDAAKNRIEPNRAYLVAIDIAPPRERGSRANVPFDESQLPQSESGHELTIAFVELRDGDEKPKSKPAMLPLHLPPSGPSQRVFFPIVTRESGTFTARVIVMHECRVLQTLRLNVPSGMMIGRMTLTQETVVQPGFDALDHRQRFDAALVVNDHDDGTPGVTAVTRSAASFFEPVELRDAVMNISRIAGKLTSLADSDLTLDDPVVRLTLAQLAQQGKLLWDAVVEYVPDALASAERIQVVEARDGAYLPVEFFYPSYAPDDDAEICPHGRDALVNEATAKCPNEKSRRYVCPAVFWAFSRVIERRPHMQLPDRSEYRLSEPDTKGMKLDPLQSAAVAASKRVQASDLSGAGGVVETMKTLVTSGVYEAPDWKKWTEVIAEHSPTLLLLMPHSEAKDGATFLEIGDQMLKSATLEEDYVRRADRDPGPVVLLLGCSTELTGVAFQNFVARFKKKGAALVIGTLSPIRGRHATRFVKGFLAALQSRKGVAFGDVLLASKREMLAQGDPFALTLIAYGDADWRL